MKNKKQKQKQKKIPTGLLKIVLTWISDDNESRSSEITVPLILPFRMVIQTHGYGGMIDQIIRRKAGASFLHHPAIHMRTSEIDIR